MGVGRAVALAGLGRGISQAGQTIGRVGREQRERKRQEEQDRRANESFELTRASAMANIAQDGGTFELDSRYYEPDGTPKPASGGGSIGGAIGASTASTQRPYESEHVPMRAVGTYGGKQLWMPRDGMSPSERTSAARERRTRETAEQEYNDLLGALAEHPRTRGLPEAVRRGLARDPAAARGALEDIQGEAREREIGQRLGAQEGGMTPAELTAAANARTAEARLRVLEDGQRRTELNGQLTNAEQAYAGARSEAGSAQARMPKPNDYQSYNSTTGRFRNPQDSTDFAGARQGWHSDTASANARVRSTRSSVDSLSGLLRPAGNGAQAPASPATPPPRPQPQQGQNQAAAQREINQAAQDAREAIAEGENEAEVQQAYQAKVQSILRLYGVRPRQ